MREMDCVSGDITVTQLRDGYRKDYTLFSLLLYLSESRPHTHTGSQSVVQSGAELIM